MGPRLVHPLGGHVGRLLVQTLGVQTSPERKSPDGIHYGELGETGPSTNNHQFYFLAIRPNVVIDRRTTSMYWSGMGFLGSQHDVDKIKFSRYAPKIMFRFHGVFVFLQCLVHHLLLRENIN